MLIKKILLFLLIASSSLVKAQTRPVDSLYIWVTFLEDNILITIPKSYITLRSSVPVLPPSVIVRQATYMVPDRPSQHFINEQLIKVINRTTGSENETDNIDFLSSFCLMLYINSNDVSYITPEIRKELERLTTGKLQSHALHVKSWLNWIKNKY